MPLATPANPKAYRSGRIDDPPAGLDIPFDQWDRRLIEAPDGSGLIHYWRASDLGKAWETYDASKGLIDWEKRSVLWSASRRPELVRAASAHLTIGNAENPEDRTALNRLVKDALNYARTSSGAIQGTALHKISEHLDAGHDMSHLDPVMRKAADTWRRMVEGVTMHLTETFVVCDEVRGAGTFDRLVGFQQARQIPGGRRITPDDRVILDLKSNKNRKYWGKVYGCQQGVYVNGVPYRPGQGVHGRLPWPDGVAPRRDIALIPWVPIANPDEGTWVVVDTEQGLKDARHACATRLNASTRGLFVDTNLAPVNAPVAAEAEHERDNWHAILLAQIEDTPSLDALKALYAQSQANPSALVWTDAHSAAATARAAQLADGTAA